MGDGIRACLDGRDGRLDARVLEHRLRMENRQEAPDGHVVDAPVVGAHFLEVVLAAGGDDRVVVRDLLVVDHSRQRQHVKADHVLRALAVFPVVAHELGDRLDLIDHVGRQVARVGAGVGERLVLLVQSLRGCQRAFGGEAEAVVGLALQRRQVVEHRRFLALLFLLELGDRPWPALARRDDRPRLLLGADTRALGRSGTRGPPGGAWKCPT